MAGVTATEIKVRKRSRVLEVAFDDGSRYELPFEYLRVFSPSAEVRGHGPGQEVLQIGKENVAVLSVVLQLPPYCSSPPLFLTEFCLKQFF